MVKVGMVKAGMAKVGKAKIGMAKVGKETGQKKITAAAGRNLIGLINMVEVTFHNGKNSHIQI